MSTGRPRWRSMRSGATLTHGSPAGNGGAWIVSTGGRTARQATSIGRSAAVDPEGSRFLMDLWTRLEQARSRCNVLEHPFYQRWSRGELELEAHAAEEAAHVALWDDFTAAIGGDNAAPADPETAACARIWAGDGERDLLSSLVALYAIESGQPAIAETKRRGLRDFYGCERGPATAYFDLHAELDHEHAAAERALIEPRLEAAEEDALVAEAEAVLRANWELLDGVERVTAERRSATVG